MLKLRRLVAMLVVATVPSVLATSTVATPAEAAEPSAAMAQQMRRGFEHCDAKNWSGYKSQRAFVQEKEPAILGYHGKIDKYDVQPTLARCDREAASGQVSSLAKTYLESMFQNCERGLAPEANKVESDVIPDSYKDFKTGLSSLEGQVKDRATWPSNVRGHDTTTYLEKCKTELGKLYEAHEKGVAAKRASDERAGASSRILGAANTIAGQALDSCNAAIAARSTSEYESNMASYRHSRAQAEKDGKGHGTLKANGAPAAAAFKACEDKGPSATARIRQEEQKAAAADKAKAEANARAIKALTGDRARIFKERGWPAYQADLKAPKWEYVSSKSVGSIGSHDVQGTCTVTYTFSGDRQTNVSKSGPGC